MPGFWAAVILIFALFALFGFWYWFVMFRPARRKDDKTDHRAAQ